MVQQWPSGGVAYLAVVAEEREGPECQIITHEADLYI